MLRVLFCKPLYYDVLGRDEDNFHMDPENRPDRVRAILEYMDFTLVFRRIGSERLFATSVPGLVDMTFTANCGFVMDNCVLLSNFKPLRRRPETEHFEAFFREHGFEIERLPEGIFFEGAGDAIPYKGKVLCGYGFRTAFQAIPYIEQFARQPVVDLALVHPRDRDKRFYHLDTAVMVLEDAETFIVYKDALSQKALLQLRELGEVIPASYEDAVNLALNAVVVPKKEVDPNGQYGYYTKDPNCKGIVVTSDLASQELIDQLTRLGYHTVLVSLREFLKSGGGAFCLTKIL